MQKLFAQKTVYQSSSKAPGKELDRLGHRQPRLAAQNIWLGLEVNQDESNLT